MVSGSITFSSGGYNGASAIGGIAGRTTGNGVISGCVSRAVVKDAYDNSTYGTSAPLGGIAGYAYGVVENCYFTGTLAVKKTQPNKIINQKRGGLVGELNANAELKGSYVAGEFAIADESKFGAVVGKVNSGATITNCAYLDTVAPQAAADGTTSGMTAHTADYMRSAEFAVDMGMNQDDGTLNGGFPVLPWQGGTPVDNADLKAAAAAANALELRGMSAADAAKKAKADWYAETVLGLYELTDGNYNKADLCKEYGIEEPGEAVTDLHDYFLTALQKHFYKEQGLDAENADLLKADATGVYQLRGLTPVSGDPEEEEEIFAYLSSGICKGVGPTTARRIVDRFGLETLDILEAEPERLQEIRGITTKKAMEIGELFRQHMGLRRLMEFLSRYQLPPVLAIRLRQQYGDGAIRVVEKNPYLLSDDVCGVDFSVTDTMALSMGFAEDCTERLEAALTFELTYNENNGHVFLPKDKLLAATCQLLGCGVEQVEAALDTLAEHHAVVIQRIANVEAVYLRRLWEAETSACARLLALLEMDADESRFADRTVAEIEKEQGITYAPLQRQAVELAAKVGVILLTGGPGTGKTTTVRGIVALFQKMGLNIVLAAPTGRAAKRMSELTGMEAQTVHRLLGMTWNEAAHQVTFQKTEKEPLEAEAVIVDEMSMVDVSLFSALLRALRPGTRLVLVGDADQLPSVGAGNVFSALIRSKKIETVFLREVFRQAEQSAIIRNAHRVNLGESPDLKGNQGDFFFLCRRDAQRAVATVLELCKTRLPDNMHIPAEQIQVLTPTRKGPCGTINLNRLLQEALNPRTPGKREILWGERVFRVGDRIMQTRNDYDVVWQKDDGTVGTGMFNGDVGRIAEIDAGGEWLALDFDGRKAPYSVEMLSEIDLAYAQTVHKAQGSEYRCVVLAAMPSAPSLMVRGVLYTALTRARELLVIVGDDAAIRSMAANDRQQKRYSGLKWRLCHAGDASE